MIDRRQFLQASGAWATLGGLCAMGEASAQTAGNYKALVCIYLAGGNDTFNTVLATDAASWSAYATVRTQQPSPIALLAPGLAPDPSRPAGSPERLGGVLALNPAVAVPNRSFALHPRLSSLRTLFNTDRRLAIVANVGSLVQPLTKADIRAVQRGAANSSSIKLPAKLYSHNDQQNTWQALSPEGARVGWGGRLMDAFVGASAQPSYYGAISVSGNAVWLSGNQVKQYQMGAGGAVALGASSGNVNNSVYGSKALAEAVRRIASNGLAGSGAAGTARANHVLMADMGQVSERSIKAEASLTAAFAAHPVAAAPLGPDTRLKYTNLNGTLATNGLAVQLQAVARVIAARSELGVGRQVFFVQLGGFDTHDNQNVVHGDLMARLDHAMAYFDETLGLLEQNGHPGLRNMVTTFTASEFGRTFTSNGDGTDHGWGAHQFVMGGAVRGGQIYGTFPKLGDKNTLDNGFDSSDDQLFNGVLLPTTSVEQLGATLAKWFEVSDRNAVFTNLRNFRTTDLGFMA
jgi:uncharacterized protein (DUF1501 family)